MLDHLIAMWDLALDGDKQGILFFASLYCFFLLSYSVVYQLRIRSWPSTSGVLIKDAVEKVGGTDLVLSRQEYAGSGLASWACRSRQFWRSLH